MAQPTCTAPDPNLRNVAIIAHVDHGKTTLVDAVFRAAGAFRDNEDIPDCVLDSNPLERERGITILSKNCAVRYLLRSGPAPGGGPHAGQTYRINIIDTPGHADFSGEVERVLRMADGALLLVDALDGPMPQTRFVLAKALELRLSLIVVVNKCDRPEARPGEVVNEVFDLLVDLGAEDVALDFPVIYASGREGWASRELERGMAQSSAAGVPPDHDPRPGETPMPPNLDDLIEMIVQRVPPPHGDLNAPLQMLVTTLDYSEYVGRIAIGRVFAGRIRSGQPIALCKADGTILKTRAQKVLRFMGLGREEADVIEAGDICAVEGVEQIDIGDTIADAESPRAMRRVAVGEPTLHMLFRINDSPFAGREGKYVTSRQISERLQRELKSNVALRVSPGDSMDEFRVSGRGLLHLSVLIENMRREGYEMSVGRPEVIEKEIDGERCEPLELLSLDLPSNQMGPALELLGSRGGEVRKMEQRGNRMHIEAHITSRGLIGFRSRLLNASGGEAVMHHIFLRYAPVQDVVRKRINGVMIATDLGTATAYSLQNLSERGVMFVQPGEPVYAGQIVGEHSRANDLPANVIKAKALSNVRESNKEQFVAMKAPRLLSLEDALEYIEGDELVEITPKSIRLRKRLLNETDRKRAERAEKSRLAMSS